MTVVDEIGKRTKTGAGFGDAAQMLTQIQVAAMAQMTSRRKRMTTRLSTFVDMTTANPGQGWRA